MPIPDFEQDGLLPPGVHDCSIDEVRSRFGTFRGSDRRARLFETLEQYLKEARSAGLVAAVIIDGSFVTGATDPNDVDLVVLLRHDHDFKADLRPFEYNVVSRRLARKRYQLDVLVAAEGSAPAAEYVQFFEQVRGLPGRRKGLLRVVP